MVSAVLNWRTVTPSLDRQSMVKGTVLECVSAGKNRRFLVESVRTYDADRNADAYYRVRDAEKVSDADVRQGKRSPVVFTSDSLDACLAFVNHD